MLYNEQISLKKKENRLGREIWNIGTLMNLLRRIFHLVDYCEELNES